MPATLKRALIDRQGLVTLGHPVLPSLYTPRSLTIDEVFPLSLIPTEVSSVWKKPTAVYNLMIQMDSDMRPRLSFTAVQEGVLYRVYRLRDGAESLVAELTGRPGDRLEYLDEAHGDSLQYYVRPVNELLSREGVLLEGDPSQIVSVAQRNPMFDWLINQAQPTPTPMPIKAQPPLF